MISIIKKKKWISINYIKIKNYNMIKQNPNKLFIKNIKKYYEINLQHTKIKSSFFFFLKHLI